MKNILFAIITLLMIVSCQESKPKPATTGNKKEIKNRKSPKKGKTKKIGAKKIANKKNTNYWSKLKKELKLTDKKTQDLKSIQTKYLAKVKATQKKQGKQNKQALTKLKKEKQANFKKSLGTVLFNKKVAFDKKFHTK